MAASGMMEGMEKGHVVTKLEGVHKKAPSRRRGHLGKRTKFVRELVQEVMGLAPYQKRIQELLKVGRDKRALKLAKKKLGTHGRAKRCRENMAALLRKARK
ncbi:60S ribosomal protein L36 [Pycnococcus provasolii]|uniref:60S ribosomal protein L36 n=2 Tax=Eukaryota TaxID=2759 RepID=A0A7R9XNR4_9CHLO|nr:60S ribosomal protein L36 [Pycnococcus provasolii]